MEVWFEHEADSTDAILLLSSENTITAKICKMLYMVLYNRLHGSTHNSNKYIVDLLFNPHFIEKFTKVI